MCSSDLTTMTGAGAASGMRDIVEKKRVEMSLDAASDIEGVVPAPADELPAAAQDTAEPSGEATP